MKLWIGGEVEADIFDAFRLAHLDVEKQINAVIANKQYSVPLEEWDCIAIIRKDWAFKEIVRYSSRRKEMDFRLVIDHGEFRSASELKQKQMICGMLLRSLDLLKKKGVRVEDVRSDCVDVMDRQGW